MAGRGGRGQALLEALKKQTQPGDTVNGSAAPAGSDHGPVTGLTAPVRGRASLLQSLAGGALSLSSDTESVSSAPSVSRASLLAFARGKLSATSATSDPAPSQPTPSHVGPSIDSLKELTLQDRTERPPVVRTGESGKPLRASANFVRIGCEPGKGFFEYEVKFKPEIDSKQMCFQLLNSCKESYGRVKNFDGVILYLPIKLPETVTVINADHPVDGSKVEIKIIFKRTRRLGESTHFYNVLFNRIFKILNFTRMGRQHYNPAACSRIPIHKLEIWPGYVTAIDEYEGGLMLNINASHRVLRLMTGYDVIQEALTGRNKDNWQAAVSKELIGSCVSTRYNNKLYRVDDIDFSSNPLATFDDRGGGKTSFVDYYKKQYDLTIRDTRQPMLISKEKRRTGPRQGGKSDNDDKFICLVPELCYLTGITDGMRQDFKIMKDIAEHTRISPNQRQLALRKFISSVKESPEASSVLGSWGLTIEDATVRFDARVVPMEKIVLGRGKEVPAGPQSDWTRDVCNSQVLTAVDLTDWAIVCTQRDRKVSEDFALCMQRVGSQLGMEVTQPRYFTLNTDRTDAYVKALRDNIRTPLQLVVTICPTSRDDRYAAIKKITCSEQPIASQVINTKTISKPDKLKSIVQKIALQINCKLGGSLWAVKIPFDGLMVCGMDVYHDPTRRGSSVTGFVASLNQPLTRWFSKVIFQTPGQELVDGLRSCLIFALRKYHDVNGKFPDRIVMFRDGVGDGELKFSAEWEIPQLLSCFSAAGPNYNPKLTVVIVQKRINCRIFHELGGNYENPPPGTVVDHTVTRRDWYDFFLVSQFSRQGTVTPTHYVVIHDGCGMKVDYVQRLTYKLTHMYYNWPGTIRVPAPCQYAHKLAYLVGQNIQKDPSDKLCDRLFFL